MDKITTNTNLKKISSLVIDVLREHRSNDFSTTWFNNLNGDLLGYNIFTGKQYDWANQILLAHSCRKNKYQFNRWISLYQAFKLGVFLKDDDQKPTEVYYYEYRHYDKSSLADITGLVKAKLKEGQIHGLSYLTVPVVKVLRVYNIQQFKRLDACYFRKGSFRTLDIQDLNWFSDDFLKACGAVLIDKPVSNFAVSDDVIRVPFKRSSSACEPFYFKAYKAVAHYAIGQVFPKKNLRSHPHFYSLLTELFIAFLAAKQGFIIPISKDYTLINHWVYVLKSDPRSFNKACAFARKSVNFVMGNAKLYTQSLRTFYAIN